MKTRGLILALALGVAGCGGGAAATAPQLNGAGATFPQPVYQEWAARFQERSGTTVNYQGIGSGGGIAQFTAGTVDFGATDSAMNDEELAAARAKGEPVHIPTVLGAVTLSYNLDGIESGMQLDGATIAAVFLGEITTWNDARIAAQNEGMPLPATNITVCRRSDESGTTKNFTEFLAAYSKAWADGPGVDKSVKWPTGTGAKGNDGVAACIQQNAGSIGYVEQAYALANDFTFASVKNQAGRYVEPTLASTSAAGADLDIPDDLRLSTIDAPGADAYPITALTFLLVHQDVCNAGGDAESANRLKAWLEYAEGEGQAVAGELQYAKLPDELHRRTLEKVDGLRCDGQPIGGT